MLDNHKILLLRVAYWFGAILDVLTFILMIAPSIGLGIFNSEGIQYGSEYLYVTAMGAPLMIGWTVLLIWADRKPIERKGIILITLFPVMTGLIAGNIILYFLEITSWIDFISRLVVQSMVVVIFSTVYWFTKEVTMDKR